jgi:hypothetical protein
LQVDLVLLSAAWRRIASQAIFLPGFWFAGMTQVLTQVLMQVLVQVLAQVN